MRRLEPVLDLCAVHGGLLRDHYQRLGIAVFEDLSPDRAPVDYARFVTEVQRRQRAGLLAGESPELARLRQRLDGLVRARARADGHVARLSREDVAALDESYLFVQGPPGTGKTWTGARLITHLMRLGRRVGVTATSHKVIHNLLAEVEKTFDLLYEAYYEPAKR